MASITKEEEEERDYVLLLPLSLPPSYIAATTDSSTDTTTTITTTITSSKWIIGESILVRHEHILNMLIENVQEWTWVQPIRLPDPQSIQAFGFSRHVDQLGQLIVNKIYVDKALRQHVVDYIISYTEDVVAFKAFSLSHIRRALCHYPKILPIEKLVTLQQQQQQHTSSTEEEMLDFWTCILAERRHADDYTNFFGQFPGINTILNLAIQLIGNDSNLATLISTLPPPPMQKQEQQQQQVANLIKSMFAKIVNASSSSFDTNYTNTIQLIQWATSYFYDVACIDMESVYRTSAFAFAANGSADLFNAIPPAYRPSLEELLAPKYGHFAILGWWNIFGNDVQLLLPQLSSSELIRWTSHQDTPIDIVRKLLDLMKRKDAISAIKTNFVNQTNDFPSLLDLLHEKKWYIGASILDMATENPGQVLGLKWYGKNRHLLPAKCPWHTYSGASLDFASSRGYTAALAWWLMGQDYLELKHSEDALDELFAHTYDLNKIVDVLFLWCKSSNKRVQVKQFASLDNAVSINFDRLFLSDTDSELLGSVNTNEAAYKWLWILKTPGTCVTQNALLLAENNCLKICSNTTLNMLRSANLLPQLKRKYNEDEDPVEEERCKQQRIA